jgi:hypothetical protein
MDLLYNFILHLPFKDVISVCCLNKEARTFLTNKHLWSQMTNGIFQKTFTIDNYIQNVQRLSLTSFRLDLNREFLYTIIPNKFKNYLDSFKIRNYPIVLIHYINNVIVLECKNQDVQLHVQRHDTTLLLKNIFINNMYAKLYRLEFEDKIDYDLF